MKTRFYSTAFLALAIAATSLQAADNKDKEKDLPPGLRKKDKLPPGWEKKLDKDGKEIKETKEAVTAVTNTSKTIVTEPKVGTPATPPVVATPAPKSPVPVVKARTPQELKASIEKNIRNVNTLDNKAAARAAGFAAISKETGVPVATIQKQQKEHEGFGSAGLLMANLIHAQTKKPAATYLRQREAGKTWAEIAADNKVSLDSADASLARVEAAMRAVK